MDPCCCSGKTKHRTPEEHRQLCNRLSRIEGQIRGLKEMLEKRGMQVHMADVCRTNVAECVSRAFQYSKMVLCASSYDGGVFLPMEDFLHHLKAKTYRSRKVALVENGTWAPSAAKAMGEILGTMKDITLCDKTVTICSAVKEDTLRQLEELADAVAAM